MGLRLNTLSCSQIPGQTVPTAVSMKTKNCFTNDFHENRCVLSFWPQNAHNDNTNDVKKVKFVMFLLEQLLTSTTNTAETDGNTTNFALRRLVTNQNIGEIWV